MLGSRTCRTCPYAPAVGTCPGSLVLHQDGTVAACSEDDESEGCAGRELRHEGDPMACIDWYGGTCNYCGIVG
jgi:hypothetical protein